MYVCMLWDIASNIVLSEGVGDSENSDVLGFWCMSLREIDACLDFEALRFTRRKCAKQGNKGATEEAKQSTQIHKTNIHHSC